MTRAGPTRSMRGPPRSPITRCGSCWPTSGAPPAASCAACGPSSRRRAVTSCARRSRTATWSTPSTSSERSRSIRRWRCDSSMPDTGEASQRLSRALSATSARRTTRSAPRVRVFGEVNDYLAAVILGLVQGLTEFLPVSSTAHLILVSDVLKLDVEKFGLTFDVALHLGTALAVLLYFAGTWIGLLVDVLRGRWRLPIVVVVGTIPAAIAGVLFESAVSSSLRSATVIAIGPLVGSAIFVIAERMGTHLRRLDRLSVVDAVIIGVAQAIALVPGISRSGITISAGLLRGVERADATRFAFLLATPVILGAGAKTLLDARKLSGLTAQLDVVAIGFIVSFLSGLAAVVFMVRYLRRHSLNVFVYYRVALAVVILAAVAMGALH